MAVAACESVVIWDSKTGDQLTRLSGTGSGTGSAVTAIAASSDNKHLAVGYEDGNVHLFDLSVVASNTGIAF